ncbi:MAG: response regulator [Chlamydiota bacterium]|nr:response regulator [Chlamydiota bacterium]
MTVRKNSILVIDDEPDMREILREIFEAEGYEAVLVSNGFDAVKKASEQHFHVVFSDLVMPGMDGVETVQKIQAICKDTLYFIMTAYPSEDRIEEALKTGVIKVFRKPFDIEEVLLCVSEALKNKKKK